MALADILNLGAAALPRMTAADRAKSQDYQTQIEAYDAEIDKFNTDVNKYNTQLEEFKAAYDPWQAKVKAYNEAVAEWNAGPRTDDYAGPSNPGEWSGGTPPTAPTKPADLPFTEDEVTAFQEQARGRAIRGAGALGTAYDLARSPDARLYYGVPKSGTSFDFSFAGTGFAEGGAVPGLPFNRSIRSISENTMTKYAPGYLADLQATGQPLPPDPMLSFTPKPFGGVKGPFATPLNYDPSSSPTKLGLGNPADPKDFFSTATGTTSNHGGIASYRNYLMDTYSPIAQNVTKDRVDQFMDMVGRAEKAHFGVQDQGIGFADGGAVDQGIGSLPEAYYGWGGAISKVIKSALPALKSANPAPAAKPVGLVASEIQQSMAAQPAAPKPRGFLANALRKARLRKQNLLYSQQQAAEQAAKIASMPQPQTGGGFLGSAFKKVAMAPVSPQTAPAVQNVGAATPQTIPTSFGPNIQALQPPEKDDSAAIGGLFAALLKKNRFGV